VAMEDVGWFPARLPLFREECVGFARAVAVVFLSHGSTRSFSGKLIAFLYVEASDRERYLGEGTS
jgi:hypothetical protein